MKGTLTRLALLGLPFALVSCVDFDEQVGYFFHDSKADEIQFLILYKDVGYAGDPTESEKQLNDFLSKPWEIALFDNWIGHLRKEAFEETLADTSSSPAERRLADWMVHHLTVQNGRFYLDKDKRLCGFQRLTLHAASEFVGAVNGLISETILKKPLTGQAPFTLDARTQRLFLQAASEKHAWLALEGQSIRFRCPFSDADYRTWKRALFDKARDGKLEDISPFRLALIENEVSLIRDGEWINLVLGNPGAHAAVRFLMKPKMKESVGSLVEHVRAKHGIDLGLDEERVVDEFSLSILDEKVLGRMNELVIQLGSDDYQSREEASRRLGEFGKLAAPVLHRAQKSKDAEVRYRAEALLSKIGD